MYEQPSPYDYEPDMSTTRTTIWENLQYAGLALTIAGQIVIGPMWLLGQLFWLIANLIAVTRDFILHRPHADKVKDIGLTALTLGLIVASFLV